MIKKLLPTKLKKKIRIVLNYKFIKKIKILLNYMYDYKIYNQYSATLDNKKNKATHSSELIFYYHKIEKGLALPSPRVGFGEEAIAYLLDSLELYVQKYGWDKVSNISLNTLVLYYEFNLQHNNNLESLSKRIGKLKESLGSEIFTNEGGTINISKKEILSKSAIDFKAFVSSRYSIRNFSEEIVSDDLVIEAIKMAQKTPSVCNRQSSKVHIFSQKEIQRKALSFQNGNAGFGESVGKVLLVTSNLEDFFGGGERNQSYIDGGMFAMSLIYALHSLGVGACALNLALDYRQAKSLKRSLNIGEKETLIMMIAVGHLPKNLEVAASPRKDIEEIIKIY